MSNIPTVKRIRLKFPQTRCPRSAQAVRQKGCRITIPLHSSTCCLPVCKMMEVRSCDLEKEKFPWRPLPKNWWELALRAGAHCVISSHKVCATLQFWSVHIPPYFPIKQGLCFHTADKETPWDTPQTGNISACGVTRWPEGQAKERPSNLFPKSTFNPWALWSKSF